VALQRGIDDSDPARPGGVALPVEVRKDHRRADSWRLATGTLACPLCDAPVALGEARLAPADRVACPYCGHGAVLRDFLSLATPSRPARVEVRVIHRARRALR